MTYATVDDVSKRLGRPITSAAEIAQVGAWLGDVGAIIRARIPDLDDRVTEGQPPQAVVVMVEASAVVRKVRNPEGKQNERIDDYSYGLSADAARGELFLTDDEWNLLLPGGSDGAWTIRPAGRTQGQGYWLHPDVWVPLP